MVQNAKSMNKFAETLAIVRSVRQKTDTAVLFYSAGGKDSIVLLDILAQVFPKVICYFMYLIKDLDHIQPYIDWAEKHYPNCEVEVRQIEHYAKDAYIKHGFFMEQADPNRKIRKVGEIEQMVRDETGIMYAFNGMKGTDGFMKRMRLKTFRKRNEQGFPITEKGMVYPLDIWTDKEVLAYIRAKNLIRPFEYIHNKGQGSQGFAIILPILLMMRKDYPNDYRKMLAEFPFAEKLVFDYDNEQQNNGN